MPKKRQNKKRKTRSLAVQRAQMLLFRLERKCVVALMLDPEHYPPAAQSKLRQLDSDIRHAMDECRAGVMPDMQFLEDEITSEARRGGASIKTGRSYSNERAMKRLRKELLES